MRSEREGKSESRRSVCKSRCKLEDTNYSSLKEVGDDGKSQSERKRTQRRGEGEGGEGEGESIAGELAGPVLAAL